MWHYLHKILILEQVLLIFDWILYVLFAINILYLLVYSLASLRRKPDKPVLAKEYKRFALLIAAYKEDVVIMDTVQACLAQDYPSDKYDVVVISDHMRLLQTRNFVRCQSNCFRWILREVRILNR